MNDFVATSRLSILIMAYLLVSSCQMKTENIESDRKKLTLALFSPHDKNFDCRFESANLPVADAESQQWFMDAIALDRPEILDSDRDDPRIESLLTRAAGRNHWKAMLNLATLYLEGRAPGRDVKDALQLVNAAMNLGVPAAFDRMGTYYMNGTGVAQDATKAYAYWQHASRLGNPDAQAYLGSKFISIEDEPERGIWANIPVGMRMLECANSQGHGNAAYELGFLYRTPAGEYSSKTGDRNRLALEVWHNGVKLGCRRCADGLMLAFVVRTSTNKDLVPYLDKARSERYDILADALHFDSAERFPNLDSVLPLPPANLPAWNGDKEALLNSARGVSLTEVEPAPTPMSLQTGPRHLDSKYLLQSTGQFTHERRAPFSGYWRNVEGSASRSSANAGHSDTAAYLCDETFRCLTRTPEDMSSVEGVPQWERMLTVRHDYGSVQPRSRCGLTRVLPHSSPLKSSTDPSCSTTGIWQPWVRSDHPLQAIINTYWRQEWITAGSQFPDPQESWMLPLQSNEIVWHLLDDAGVSIL